MAVWDRDTALSFQKFLISRVKLDRVKVTERFEISQCFHLPVQAVQKGRDRELFFEYNLCYLETSVD